MALFHSETRRHIMMKIIPLISIFFLLPQIYRMESFKGNTYTLIHTNEREKKKNIYIIKRLLKVIALSFKQMASTMYMY